MVKMAVQRIEQLRSVMKEESLAAFIVPSTDPHNGEYVPDRWKCREWITGFDGSAGTAVVTMTRAALWTDSRYFIAAQQQLEGTGIELMKLKVAGTPTIAEWLEEELTARDYKGSTEVGIDGMCSSISTVEGLIEDLRSHGGLTLRTNLDPFERIWKDRPDYPMEPVKIYPVEYAGETTDSKLIRIRRQLRQSHADGMLVSALDDIAWTLNLRGSDVECTPVFVSYLLISQDRATLFVDSRKLSADVVAYLKGEGVTVDEYRNVSKGLKDYFEYNILIDPDEVAYTLLKKIERIVVRGKSPIPSMKSVKNATEQQGFRQAMLRDGIAMTKFLAWLKPAVEAGGQTEITVSEKLTSLRAEQALFCGNSFATISAYQEHGAIVHYEPTVETDVELKPEGLLLLDSGGQYLDGTTDITRTIALGPLTDEQRKVYTLVLKGHIQLQMAVFPDGTRGTQLDVLARQAMWREGYNYLHGTGHGVGAYLSVHEGPHQIRMENVDAPLHAGMTVTDEPGIYLEGKFGVRTENMLLVVEDKQTDFGKFLKFETLTLCPIDLEPVVSEMLTAEEKDWLKTYHQRVWETLSPHLDGNELEWLKRATRALEN